jgi:hypothetical protein
VTKLWPLAFYAALALLFWGPWVLDDPSTTIVAANDVDPSAYLWFFSWWPHALLHGLNPFYTDLLFVPDGYNLAWVTSMPGPSLLLAPVTVTLGAPITWNILSFASPALSAWTAFLLCRHVTGATLPSVVGGYLFGFSPYMLSQLRGAPQLALVALLPLLVLMVVRHLDGSMADRRFVFGTTAALTAQMLVSTEVLATSVVFGALTMITGYLLYPKRRAGIRRTTVLIGLSLLLTAVLASPLLAYVAFGDRTLPAHALADFPADLLSFVVPGSLVAATPERFGGSAPDWATGAAYVGLPLLIVVIAFTWSHRNRRAAILVVASAAICALAALGTSLYVGGRETGVPMPWAVFAELPLLRYAIPLRFSLFVFLALALVVAMWLAWSPSPTRWALAALSLLFVAPALGNSQWQTDLKELGFFDESGYEAVLGERDRVLTMPAAGRNMRWHAEAKFSFEMAAGYVGAAPESYERYAAWRLLTRPFARIGPDSAAQLRRFIADKGVTAIVAESDVEPRWRRLFDSLGSQPTTTGGVLIYRLAPPPAG